MREDIDAMLDLMQRSFRDFESGVPHKPELVELPFGLAWRFIEKDIYQAIFQKLARVQSFVRAAKVLLDHGFVQEQAALHRMIDETNEDIMFLVYAVTNDTVTDLHKQYLDAFWEEEIDESGALISSEQKRPMIPRKKIRAYLARIEKANIDESSHNEVMRTINKAYSGYVHGASPHIMEMYGGDPPRFHIDGMMGTRRMIAHADDLWNYAYRSFVSHIAFAKAVGAADHVKILTKHLDAFERNAGMHK
jgi:hypothetical protein